MANGKRQEQKQVRTFYSRQVGIYLANIQVQLTVPANIIGRVHTQLWIALLALLHTAVDSNSRSAAVHPHVECVILLNTAPSGSFGSNANLAVPEAYPAERSF